MPNPVLKAQKFTSEPLGPRSVRVQCSSATVDRTGEIVVQAGIKFAHSIPVLFGHDAQMPVGRAEPRLVNGNLVADVAFAPPGVSAKADEICGLVKAGIVNTADSIKDYWTPDWTAYIDNEQDIVETVNGIFAG